MYFLDQISYKIKTEVLIKKFIIHSQKFINQSSKLIDFIIENPVMDTKTLAPRSDKNVELINLCIDLI